MAERLNSRQLLPAEATEDLLWAFDQAVTRRMTQKDMLAELNRRLDAKGIQSVTMSALNRWVLNVRAGRVNRPPSAPSDTAAPPALACPHRGGRLGALMVVARFSEAGS